MKIKIKIIILIILYQITGFSQKLNYMPFKYGGFWGISDNKGNELLAPEFEQNLEIYNDKTKIVLQTNNHEYLFLNLLTGKNKKYSRYENNLFTWSGENYSLVCENSKNFLKSENSNKIFNLPNKIGNLKSLGNLLLLENVSSSPMVENQILKDGKLEIQYEFVKDFKIFKPSPIFKPLFEKMAIYCFPLYRVKKQPETNEIKLVTLNKPSSIELHEEQNADYIVVEKKNYNYEIYDSNLKLLKKTYIKGGDNEFLEKVSKIIGKEVSMGPEPEGTIMDVGDSIYTNPVKSIFKNGIYTVSKTVDGSEIIICQSSNKLEYIQNSEGMIRLTNEKNNEEKISLFSFDYETLELFLPTSYLKILGLNIPKE